MKALSPGQCCGSGREDSAQKLIPYPSSQRAAEDERGCIVVTGCSRSGFVVRRWRRRGHLHDTSDRRFRILRQDPGERHIKSTLVFPRWKHLRSSVLLNAPNYFTWCLVVAAPGRGGVLGINGGWKFK